MKNVKMISWKDVTELKGKFCGVKNTGSHDNYGNEVVQGAVETEDSFCIFRIPVGLMRSLKQMAVEKGHEIVITFNGLKPTKKNPETKYADYTVTNNSVDFSQGFADMDENSDLPF